MTKRADQLAAFTIICTKPFVPIPDHILVEFEYDCEGDQQPLIWVDEPNFTHWIMDGGPTVVVINYGYNWQGEQTSAVYEFGRFVANEGWVDLTQPPPAPAACGECGATNCLVSGQAVWCTECNCIQVEEGNGG